MATVHRSYRADQRTQYAFEALCHLQGMQPSALIETLIDKHVKDHPDLAEVVNSVVDARVKRTNELAG